MMKKIATLVETIRDRAAATVKSLVFSLVSSSSRECAVSAAEEFCFKYTQ